MRLQCPVKLSESPVVYNWWCNLKFKKGALFSTEDSCLKESVGKLDQVDLHTATFHTREAFFSGVANSGEIKLVALEAANDRPLELRLKFILMVNTSRATKTH